MDRRGVPLSHFRAARGGLLGCCLRAKAAGEDSGIEAFKGGVCPLGDRHSRCGPRSDEAYRTFGSINAVFKLMMGRIGR